MKITTKARQTIFDLALEQYGTCEAIGEILALNPDIANDPRALAARGIDSIRDESFYLDVALEPGTELTVDPDSMIRKSNIIKELDTPITTYDHGTDD